MLIQQKIKRNQTSKNAFTLDDTTEKIGKLSCLRESLST